jgi:long-chain fatty acid transport protein
MAGTFTSRRGVRILATAALVALLAPVARDARAGGFHTPDFGTRRCGMMAVMGKPDDVTAIFHNPAGLTLQKGTNLYLAGQYTQVELGFKFYDSQGKLRPDKELSPDQSWGILPFLGVGTDFGTKKLRGGLALYAPNLFGAFLPEDAPTRYHLVSGFFAAVHATGTLAYQFTKHLSVGAGISAVYMRMQGKQYFNPLVASDPDLRFDSSEAVRAQDIKLELLSQGWTWDWNVGILIKPIETLGLGFSFISGADVTLKGDVKATPAAGGGGKSKQTTTMAIPFTLRGGINWEVAPGFELGLDFFYWHYQVLQEQVMKLEKPLYGMKEQRTPKAYKNAWNISAGLLYRPIDQVDVMVGYQRDKTPIPNETLSLDNITRDHHGVSCGVRWRALDWLAVGLTFQRTWYDLMNIQTSILNPPVNGKGHGSMTHIAMDFSFRL